MLVDYIFTTTPLPSEKQALSAAKKGLLIFQTIYGLVSRLLAATGHLQVPSSVQTRRSKSSSAKLDSKVQEITSKPPFYLGISRGRSFSLAMQSSEQVQRTEEY